MHEIKDQSTCIAVKGKVVELCTGEILRPNRRVW